MLNEGILDTLSAGLAGAIAGIQSGSQGREGQKMQQEVAAEFIQRWNEAIAQDPATNTPENIKQFMHNSTRKSGITVPEPPATLNNASAAQYITKVIGQSLAAYRLGLNKGKQTAEPGQETTKAANAPQLTTGFAMVDDDPVTIKYKNQDFIRNDKGQWAPLMSPNKPITDSATAKMFDKQEQAIENWKAARDGTTPPPPKTTTTPSATDTSATDTSATPSPVKPDDRTAKELLSPAGIKDPESEIFIPGHGIVQKQEDGSWRSLPKKAPINQKDWAALDKRLEAAKAAPEPEAATEPTAGSTEAGAPLDSTFEVSSGAVSVTFKKTDKGWVNTKPTASSTAHGPGTKGYDALERAWAKKNGQPEPKPTVGATPAAPTPTAEPATASAMTESFKRLDRITHGKI